MSALTPAHQKVSSQKSGTNKGRKPEDEVLEREQSNDWQNDGARAPAGAAVTSGTAYSWSYNYNGQLGNETNGGGTETNLPGAVKNITGVNRVKAGCDHSLALKTDGTVRAWGYNQFGQLGNDTSGAGADRSTPTNVIGLDNVSSIAGGKNRSLAVLESGRARSWGSNDTGELGNGAFSAGSDVPVAVQILLNVRNIDGGYGFTLAATR